ncbi:MAG: hypothetical protein ABI548_14605 [Polyangiaceae bacterium]
MSNKRAGSAPKEAPEQTSVLARRVHVEPWHDPQWQQLWLAIERRPWRSLVLIPAGEGAPLDFTVSIAVNLSRTAMVHIGSAIQVADGTIVPLNQLNPFLNEVRRCTSSGERLIVALPPTDASPVTASIAQSSDAAVLCILLERMASADANKTVKLIGPKRFLGSVLVHPDQLENHRG